MVPYSLHLFLTPKQSFVDLPHVRKSNVVDVRLDLELSFLRNFLKLLLGKSIFESILLLAYHFLLVGDLISFTLGDIRKHSFWKHKPETLGILIDLEGIVDLIDESVGFIKERS